MSAQFNDTRLGGDSQRANGANGATAANDASIGSLLKDLAHEVPGLLRDEVQLAKTEARVAIQGAQQAAAATAVAGAVATGGMIVLLMAAVYGLAQALDMDLWLSALIVGTVALGIGMAMLASAKRKLADGSLMPRRTLDTLRQGKDALRGRTS
jgi:hypothetical protein